MNNKVTLILHIMISGEETDHIPSFQDLMEHLQI